MKDNPIYSNYVFSEFDLDRVRIKWWEYPQLWFRPTHVQLNDGYAVKFKTTSNGRYFLMDVERFEP